MAFHIMALPRAITFCPMPMHSSLGQTSNRTSAGCHSLFDSKSHHSQNVSSGLLRELSLRTNLNANALRLREGEYAGAERVRRAVTVAGPTVELEAEQSTAGVARERPPLALLAAAKVIPHPDKIDKGGEDAHLLDVERVPAVLCVADGVGGWAEDGVDPALYSREFVTRAREALDADPSLDDPRRLLHCAHENMVSPGATTAITAMVDATGRLSVANLGDSGLRIVRNGFVVFGTPAQQHFFDCPYQFGSESDDSAADAKVYDLQVEEGDTLVMASDGFFDNVFDRDLASVVSVFGGSDLKATEHTASALAELASKHANDTTYSSPYIMEAIDQGQDVPIWQKVLGRKLTGGKLDDITVLVASVVPRVEVAPPALEETSTDLTEATPPKL
eukprot:TRINITY_DN101_c0_g1_i4.p1 TRINITY_DN101_c0_g1~~TRINITY_DN101_c0_g1_i4.p1  ORF type:complete len:391 (-),score=73.79 TRINITY_DN101_c0_g1_i4:288-1460(-)